MAIAALTAVVALGLPDRAAAQTESGGSAPKPNIVVILADDIGWGQPGFNGGTEVSTPNIDRIADEGVKLTQFYVQPQCAPSRAALLTGRYAWKNGVGTNQSGLRTGGIHLDERTIAQALGDAGYGTWIVGKWGVGHWRTEHLPLQRGFDHHYGTYTGLIDSFTHLRGDSLDWHRNGRPVVETGYSSFLLAEEAVQLIGRHDGTDPFFLYLSFNAVHTPHQAPREYLDLYSGSHYKQRAMLKAMDDAIGSVLAALESKGVVNDTLVMFLGDNGDAPEAGTKDDSPYRGEKATYFEGGILVPAAARWPGKIPADSESDALLHAVDLFPTFAGLAGASTTDGLPLDGLDAWTAIADGGASPRTELVHSPDVLRQGDWKLIEETAHTNRWESGELRLFNIAEDPYEATNLADTETAKVAEMSARLDDHEQFARTNNEGQRIDVSPLTVFGEEENEVYGPTVWWTLNERASGNTVPTLVRLEAVGDQVKLSYDEALYEGAVPPASAFDVVVNPGYNTAEVEAVDIDGHAVLLTLADAPAATDTVGLTYNVPDTAGTRDLVGLQAVGVTWVTGAVKSAFLSGDATLGALSLSGIDIGTFSSATTSYSAAVAYGVSTTTVTATAAHSGATVAISPTSPVSLAEGANEIAVTVTAEDGLTTRTYTVTVTRAAASDDATLGALSLSGVDIGTFSSATTSYSAAVGYGVSTTTVTASGSHSGATVAISPASPVSLAEGANEIAVTVTAEDGSTTRTYTVTVTRAAASDDASLSALSLSGIDIGTFSSTVTEYAAEVENGVATTTVTATATHSGASVSIVPSGNVSLSEGANEIVVTVTAQDGATTGTYTVTVTRAALPVVSIVAVASPVSEGEAAQFRVTRTGPLTDALSVKIRADRVDIAMPFRPGRGSRVGSNLSGDDTVVEDDVSVTWTIRADDAYAIAPDAGSATVLVEDDDVAEFAVSIAPAEIGEGASATAEVRITNGVTFAAAQTIEFGFAGSTATKDTDYTVAPGAPTLGAGARRTTATVAALADSSTEDDETVSLAASHDGQAIGTVSLTIKDAAVTPLTAEFLDVPATHDGDRAFEFELRFSEEFPIGFRRLRDEAFDVTGGTVRRAKRVVKDSNLRWSIRVKPASDADVTVALPATTDCADPGAICTASGKPLSNSLSATVTGPGTSNGFSLAAGNDNPSGIWADGRTAWVADAADARLYAYRLADGARLPERDVPTEPGPMGLWSDGDTMWVARRRGGLVAHRLADGMRQPERDLVLPAAAAPVGLWSNGETVWVADWLGDTVRAYGSSDGRRTPARDIRLAGGNLLPVGVWSDGGTMWVADWGERIYAYRLSDGEPEPGSDIATGTPDADPSGLWSNGTTLLSTGWERSEVSAYELPRRLPDEHGKAPFAAEHVAPMLADPGLRRAVEAALGEASEKARRKVDLAHLKTLQVRNAGVMNLTGLESAVSLRELDLGFNPLTDLRPLAMLPALVSLNLDGTSADLEQLAPLTGLKRLSLRHSGFESLVPLAGMTSLAELDVGDNRIEDLHPLAGLTGLQALRANGNRIADVRPLSHLARLEVLDLGRNRIRDLYPLAGLVQLRTLRLDGNGLTALHSLSGLNNLVELGLAGNAVEDIRALTDLAHLQRLDLRGNPVAELWALSGLPSLVWVHVGASRIGNLAPLDGLPGLTVAGREDLEPPRFADGQAD